MKLKGLLVDIHERKIFPAIITITNGRIESIIQNIVNKGKYILPGLIDAHIHIESSMVTPGSFALEAVSCIGRTMNYEYRARVTDFTDTFQAAFYTLN